MLLPMKQCGNYQEFLKDFNYRLHEVSCTIDCPVVGAKMPRFHPLQRGKTHTKWVSFKVNPYIFKYKPTIFTYRIEYK